MHARTTLIAAMAVLAGCAAHPRQMYTWAPNGTPSLPVEQALAQCSYDIARDDRNFGELFLLSGQPKVHPRGGVQGLNPNGVQLFKLCMAGKGYRDAGMVDVDE